MVWIKWAYPAIYVGQLGINQRAYPTVHRMGHVPGEPLAHRLVHGPSRAISAHVTALFKLSVSCFGFLIFKTKLTRSHLTSLQGTQVGHIVIAISINFFIFSRDFHLIISLPHLPCLPLWGW
jgi:hypothetical protein